MLRFSDHHIDHIRGNNNYMNSFYFSPPRFSLITSIDFILLSGIGQSDLQGITDMLLSSDFKVKGDGLLEKGNYDRKRTFTSPDQDTAIDILYGQRKSFGRLPGILLRIGHPIGEVMSLLDDFFRNHGFFPKVSQIELSFDFITRFPALLEEFLRVHLHLRYQRSKSFQYEGTYYTTNVRKATKGNRLYQKRIDGRTVVRLELRLNRRCVRRAGLVWPLDEVEGLDLTRFFFFKKIRKEALTEHLIWKERDAIQAAEGRLLGSGNIVRSTISSWVDSVMYYRRKCMERVEVLKDPAKGVPNYYRFLEPLNEFNQLFLQMVKSQRFIPSRQESHRNKRRYQLYALRHAEDPLPRPAWAS
jgi:hypothetical protein